MTRDELAAELTAKKADLDAAARQVQVAKDNRAKAQSAYQAAKEALKAAGKVEKPAE